MILTKGKEKYIKLLLGYFFFFFMHSLDIQEPLNRGAWNSCPRMSTSLNLVPLTLGPSSGGVSSTTDVTIKASTNMMTKSAIKIPRQFLCWVFADTNSWKKLPHPIRHLLLLLNRIFFFFPLPHRRNDLDPTSLNI